MNIDFIRAKIKLLHGANSQEKDTIIASIGVCAGLISAQEQSSYLSPQKRHQVIAWLSANAVHLKLPQLPEI